ncbi:L,D-transpeptidase [Sphingomonas flavalba]|uniref:L,D-transpeptidase n=1 Tax=Sphingomonas flavalba TaxID=2559804 RepID=UPI0039DFA6A8
MTAPVVLSRRRLMAAVPLLALFGAAPALAQSLASGSIADSVERMKPGEYLWAPDIAPQGPVVIIVSIETQRAYVYRNGVLIGISTASTGKAGHETPTGVFTILQKKVDHKSNLYNNAPMPFMQRLTWDGIAMHAGNLPGYPASHGCIRLPRKFAEQLYAVTRLGLTVVVTDRAAVPRIAPEPGFLQEPAAEAATLAGRAWWRPERAPDGPLSIVISTADRRMLVLRNGVTIGSAPVAISETVDGPRAYTLRAVDAAGFHWMRLLLPGQGADGEPAEVSSAERARLRLPEDFRQALAAALAPGATVVVTTDTLQSGATGRKLTVIAGEDRPE